jgi:4'-phosphopantetheinyl transferase
VEIPRLVGRDIHLWFLKIGGDVSDLSSFESLLDDEELARAHRFRLEHLTRDFVIRRCALRILLGAYLNEQPEAIRYRAGFNGKPELEQACDLQFNTSGSHHLAAFAFTRGCELGVDVEHVRQFHDLDGLVKRFFASSESSELFSLSEDDRETAFFLCWTRKEAFVKAHGNGLSTPLDSFEVTLRPDKPARFLSIGGDQAAANEWSLEDLNPMPGYAGALAYRDSSRPLLRQPLLTPWDFLARVT